MTRGTVLLVGQLDRESELLANRLEREKFALVLSVTERQLVQWCRTNTAQAVFFSRRATRQTVERSLQSIRAHKHMAHIPAILIADTDVAPNLVGVKGIGEVFRLHQITLAEAVRRLVLAIQLTQLARR